MSNIVLHYTIFPGDSFSKIASDLKKCSGISKKQIAVANKIPMEATLIEGQKLIIRSIEDSGSSFTYQVQPGDTLEKIVNGLNAASGVTTKQIQAANPDLIPTLLQIGEVINIPGKTATAESIISEISADEIIGYWDWTWEHSLPLSDAAFGVAFSGWADVATAIQQSNKVKDELEGLKYISLGGGNKNGAFTESVLQDIIDGIQGDTFKGWDGIAFDVEEGDTGLAAKFSETFAEAQKAGFKVLVTVSHSAPFGIADGATLMQSFFNDSNIDILSPQLYTTGEESQNDYAITEGVKWSSFGNAHATIVPSIVQASYFSDVKKYFSSQGVELKGFIQWKQVVSDDHS